MHFTCYWVPYITRPRRHDVKLSFFFVDEYSAPYASCWSFIDLIIARATRCRCIIYTTGGWHVPVQLAANVSISQLSKSRRMLSCCRSRRMKVRYRDGGEEADAIRPLAATLRRVHLIHGWTNTKLTTLFLLLFLLSPTNQMSNEHASLVYEGPVTVHRRGNLFHANWCNSRVYTACHQRAEGGGNVLHNYNVADGWKIRRRERVAQWGLATGSCEAAHRENLWNNSSSKKMENTLLGRQGKESPVLITLYVCLAFVILSLSFEEIQLPTNHAGFVRGRDAVS